MATGICPECEGEVHVSSDVEVGEFVTCPECDTELEVIETDPVEFDIAGDFEEEEEEDEEW
jgi:alpha-aminoadipate carrier protein LysW